MLDWLFVTTLACAAPGSAGVTPEGETRMLDRAQIVAAVQASGDRELVEWVSSAEPFGMERVPIPELTAHAVFRVLPTGLSQPMSFYVASSQASGEVFVLSGQIKGLARLLRAEPQLGEKPSAALRFTELLSDLPDSTLLVEDPAAVTGALGDAALQVLPAVIERRSGGWAIRLVVLDDAGRLQRWAIDIPAEGDPSWKRSTLARSVARKAP